CDLTVALAALWFELAIERQRAAAHPGSDGDVAALENAGLLSRRRQIEAHHVIEVAAVENENAGAIVYARARIRGRDEAAQHRHVEKNDAPAQARKSDADKEMPALQQEDGKAPSPSFRERCPVLALLLFQLDLEAFQRFIESAKAQGSCAGKELPAFGHEFA